MDALQTAFHFVCGQGRCFSPDGVALPVCQRCTGLYLGALFTSVWIFLIRLGRRGLPPRGLVLAEAAGLIAALLGGLHILDPGSAWRLWCGLWTGHIVLLWLVTGATQLRTRLEQPRRYATLGWSGPQHVAGWIALAVLPLVAALLNRALTCAWWLWTALIVAGAASLLMVLLRVAWTLAALFVPLFRRRRDHLNLPRL